MRAGMAIVVNRCADRLSTVCRLDTSRDTIANTYARQALPIVWDYCEGNPFSNASGSYEGALDWVAKVVEAWPGSTAGQVQLADAAEHPFPDQTASVWFTDPPYYDSVPYADLSDFFLVWLKRAFTTHPLLQDPFDPHNPLTPKIREAVRDEQVHLDGRAKKSAGWYEQTMHRAFKEGRRVLQANGVGSIVFAHKTTEGWEALLSGITRGGWTVTASWAIATEMGSRLRARQSAVLATSVHLICRPRPEGALVGDWADVLRELPNRVGDWMERLQGEGVRGADLVFACIGPALEIFSRYAKVETADGREVLLAEYLEKVWEVVGRSALAQVLSTAEVRARNGRPARSRRMPGSPRSFFGRSRAQTARPRRSRVKRARTGSCPRTRTTKRAPRAARPRVSRWSSTSCAGSRSRSALSCLSGKAASSRRRRASCVSCPSPSGA